MAAQGPIVLLVAYPSTTPAGKPTKFNMDYYLNGHMVLIDKAWKPFGLKSWTVTSYDAQDSLDGTPPPYCAQATLHFDSVEDIKEALAKGSEETGADVANYTDVTPVIWVSRLVKENQNCQT